MYYFNRKRVRVMLENLQTVPHTAMLRGKGLFKSENQSLFNILQAEYWLNDVNADGHARGYDRQL